MTARPHSYRQEAHGIFSVQLYDAPECRSVSAVVSRIRAWHPAAVGNARRAVVDTTIRVASYLERSKAAAIHDDFERKVLSIITPAVKQTWGCDFASCDGTHLLRYRAGGYFLPHQDAGDGAYETRYFTILCYLNENFGGGNTSFASLRYSAKPISGRALVFPSRFIHCAEPVIAGQKLVFVTWFCGPRPLRWI